MRYSSTRGNAPILSFDDAVLAGLASDGGLYVPESLPQFSIDDLRTMRTLNYVDLAVKIMLPFMGNGWDEQRLKPLVEKSYSNFRHADIAPLIPLKNNHYILELFHGPTLAFKDFALQFLGHLLGDILSRRQQKITILGATSGDTGSAAIAGCSGIPNVNIFILYPHGRVSDVQRRQMTTLHAENVHALALEGSFDDCQNIVKACFADQTFNQQHSLVAVNSINWARIMAQIVYYFYAALKLGAPEKSMVFSVPTGNFGDILAGWLAKHMGLPIQKLLIASNANDILTRCWQSGRYETKEVLQTLSPSMDIQISSNFERLLYMYANRDSELLNHLMQSLKNSGLAVLPETISKQFTDEFFATSTNDAATLTITKRTYDDYHILIDPHTATGLDAAERFAQAYSSQSPIATLATAHPAKFPDAVKRATNEYPKLPDHLADLFDKKEYFSVLPANNDAVKAFVIAHS